MVCTYYRVKGNNLSSTEECFPTSGRLFVSEYSKTLRTLQVERVDFSIEYIVGFNIFQLWMQQIVFSHCKKCKNCIILKLV